MNYHNIALKMSIVFIYVVVLVCFIRAERGDRFFSAFSGFCLGLLALLFIWIFGGSLIFLFS